MERNVTGVSSIPAGTVQTGTVTASTVGDKSYITGTSTLFTEVFRNYKKNHYLFVPSTKEMFKVKGVFSDTKLWVEKVTPGAVSASGAAYQSVISNLTSYSLVNNGGNPGEINGVTIEDGQTITKSIDTLADSHRNLPAEVISGTGTNLFITESY